MSESDSRSPQAAAGAGRERSLLELQSALEELTAANATLKHEVDELWRANSDLSTGLASTSVATLFLDPAVRIVRYTPAAAEFFHLGPSDLGRPLMDFLDGLMYPEAKEDVGSVLETLVPVK